MTKLPKCFRRLNIALDALHRFILSPKNIFQEKKNELNKDEFTKFWSDVYALFDKFDKNGDGNIDLEEAAELLGDKADQFGLSKKGLGVRSFQ